MKKKIIPLFVLMSTMGAYAQIGIGTELPHGSAELEISSASKGVLIPRVALKSAEDKVTIEGGTQAESLLVYHTGENNLQAGFYFWATNKWNALVSNSTLYTYIKETAKDGNVTITPKGTNDFTFTWIDKTTKNEMSIDLSELIKKSSITETDTPITPVTVVDGATTKRTGEYKYKSEAGTEVSITVVDDVKNNFQTIISDPAVTTVLNNYIKNKALGNVTYEGGKFYVTISDGNGGTKTDEINITELIKANSVVAKLTITDETVNAKAVKGGFTFNDGKESSTDKAFAETLTSITKAKDNTNNKLIAYNYTDETGKNAIAQITVSADVINDFQEIVDNTNVQQILNTFITNNTGDVKIVKDGVTGDLTITYSGGSFNLTQEIANKQKYTEVKLVDKIKDSRGSGVTITTNKPGSTPVSFDESLTKVDRHDGLGALSPATGATVGFTYYKYIDESGKENYITVSQDVSNDFEKIVNAGTNKTFIENIVKSTGGNASISKGANGDIIITDVTKTAPDNVYNITELIKANGAIAQLTKTDAANNENGVKAGFTFNAGKSGSTDVKFAETLTIMKKEAYKMYVYLDTDAATGEQKEVHEEVLRDTTTHPEPPINSYDAYKFTYFNEKGDEVVIKGNDLFGTTGSSTGTGGSMETLTTFRLDPDYETHGPSLVYTDEKRAVSYVPVSDMFKQSETETRNYFDF